MPAHRGHGGDASAPSTRSVPRGSGDPQSPLVGAAKYCSASGGAAVPATLPCGPTGMHLVAERQEMPDRRVAAAMPFGLFIAFQRRARQRSISALVPPASPTAKHVDLETQLTEKSQFWMAPW